MDKAIDWIGVKNYEFVRFLIDNNYLCYFKSFLKDNEGKTLNEFLLLDEKTKHDIINKAKSFNNFLSDLYKFNKLTDDKIHVAMCCLK